MANKKSFKDNPALAFISTPEGEAGEITEKPQPKTGQAGRRKKAPEGYKPNPEYIETKSRRVQLLLQPSVADAIKAVAVQNGISLNEACTEAILEYIERKEA